MKEKIIFRDRQTGRILGALEESIVSELATRIHGYVGKSKRLQVEGYELRDNGEVRLTLYDFRLEGQGTDNVRFVQDSEVPSVSVPASSLVSFLQEAKLI